MEAPRSLQGPRRHRRARDLTRGLGLCALTLALLGPLTASADAAAGPSVVFSSPAFGTRAIAGEELEARAPGLHEATYLIRASPGEAGEEVTRRGMPVGTALEKAGVQSFGYLTIPRPNGTTAYLPASWFLEPASFEAEKPAVFSVDGGSTRFIRPLLAADPGDANAEDNIATVSGEPLVVGVHDGSVVTVEVSASATATASGSPVQFAATARGGASPEERFTFSWSFGDGTVATGAAASHSFAGSGTYAVRVTATGSEGSGGESGPVEVVVGSPPTTSRPGASPTATPTQQAAGADGEGGEGRGGKGSTATPTPAAGGKHGSAHADRRRPRRSRAAHHVTQDRGEPAARVPAPAAVAPPPTEVASAAAEEAGSGDGSEATSGSPTRGSSARPVSTAGEEVEGRLVGDDLGPTTIEEAAGAAVGSGSRSAPGAVAGGGGDAPVVALIVVGLLAAGALFEWRRWRPLR